MVYQGNDALEITDEFGFLRKHGLMYQEQTAWVSSMCIHFWHSGND